MYCNNIPRMSYIYYIYTSYCLLAKEELGLKTYTIEDTLRDTGLSYMTLGLIKNANL